MAIRNELLNGNDFRTSEPKWLTRDFNDTVDEIVRLVERGI